MPTLPRTIRFLAPLLVLAALVAAAPASAGKIPKRNLVDNPTFRGSTGWVGFNAKVTAVRDRRAPDGRTVGRVAKRKGARYTIDDSAPAVAAANAGAAYSGAAWVKGSKRTAGRKVELVLREVDQQGTYVGESTRRVRLRAHRYKRVRVTRRAKADGDSIDVYVRASGARANLSFYVDAVSVTPSTNTTEPPVDPEDPDDPSDPSAPGPITTSQIALVTSQEDPLFENDGSKYRYIVVRDNMSGRVGDLRKAHPEADVILYKNVGFTNAEDCKWAPYQGTGVNFCDADSHESWFLHKRTAPSKRIGSDGYPGYVAMNIGNSGYQRAWAQAVIARLSDARNDGSNARYDGVWMDDTNLFPGHGMDGSIDELSDSRYRNATVDFISQVAPQIEAAGFKTVVNLGMNPWESDQVDAAVKIARNVSVVNREGLVRWGDDGMLFSTNGDAPFWNDEVKAAERMQAAGTDLHAITYGSSSDVRAQRYARATFLMAWNGSDGGALNYRTTQSNNSWRPDWTTDVGKPAGPRTAVGRGYVRKFSGGFVVINPSASGSQSFDLPGSYRDPDTGSCVSRIALSATRAAILPAC